MLGKGTIATAFFSLSLASCSRLNQTHDDRSLMPVQSGRLGHKKARIADVLPLGKNNGLRDLLSTFPNIFEIAPEQRHEWILQEGHITKNKLTLPGDGARSSLALAKTDQTDIYRLTVGPDEYPGIEQYLLRRTDGGWHILDIKQTKPDPAWSESMIPARRLF